MQTHPIAGSIGCNLCRQYSLAATRRLDLYRHAAYPKPSSGFFVSYPDRLQPFWERQHHTRHQHSLHSCCRIFPNERYHRSGCSVRSVESKSIRVVLCLEFWGWFSTHRRLRPSETLQPTRGLSHKPLGLWSKPMRRFTPSAQRSGRHPTRWNSRIFDALPHRLPQPRQRLAHSGYPRIGPTLGPGGQSGGPHRPNNEHHAMES